jgi:thioesterase domain-containing protein
MTTAELLATLRERDVRLWLEEGKLKCDAPPGVLDDGWRRELSARKDELATLIANAEATLDGPRSLVPLKPTGESPPLFARPGHNGDVFCYVALGKYLDPRRPLYGVEPMGLDGGPLADTVEDMAAYEVEQIRGFQPVGPYHLAGFCAGGAIAFESARQLLQAGQEVARVILFGAPFPSVYRGGQVVTQVRRVRHAVRRHAPALTEGSVSDRVTYVRGHLRERASDADERRDPAFANRRRIEDTTIDAVKRYEPGMYLGRVDAFLPSEAWRHSGEGSEEWKTVAPRVIEHVGPDGADGDNMLKEPHVQVLAALLNATLENDSGETPHAVD